MRAAAPPEVTVSTWSRAVRLHAPAVFRPADGQAAAGFLARVSGVHEIHSIRIDFRSGTAAMHYEDGRQPAVVLEKLAAALNGADPPLARGQFAKRQCTPADDVVTLYRCGGRFSTWRVLVSERGVMRVSSQSVRAGSAARELVRQLVRRPGIGQVRWHAILRELTVHFDSTWNEERLLAELDDIVGEPRLASTSRGNTPGSLAPVRLAGRALNLSLAGASFALAGVGVTVPGIPTVPFLLSTSYFLVRSSPRLNERLLASRTFGGLLRDWQQHGGMRRRVKIIAVAVMLVVATLTILTAQLSVVMLVVVLLLMAVGVWMVVRTPTISDAACPEVTRVPAGTGGACPA